MELKEQALQKAQMRIKELEFAQESYLEYQQQAKVCIGFLGICTDKIIHSN